MVFVDRVWVQNVNCHGARNGLAMEVMAAREPRAGPTVVTYPVTSSKAGPLR